MREDLLEFATHCLKLGHNGKTHLQQAGRDLAADEATRQVKILNPSDWPSFVETVRPIYEDGELEKLFHACTPTEEIRFKFYLMSGFRDAEGRFITWRDVDFSNTAIRVTAKAHWGFQPEELGGAGSPGPAEADYIAGEIPSGKGEA